MQFHPCGITGRAFREDRAAGEGGGGQILRRRPPGYRTRSHAQIFFAWPKLLISFPKSKIQTRTAANYAGKTTALALFACAFADLFSCAQTGESNPKKCREIPGGRGYDSFF
jgi:hypothetical protein